MVLVSSGAIYAQTVTPTTQFQYSNIAGSGNSIVATRVPVTNSTGTTVYRDITLQFDVDSDWNPTITDGFPVVIASPDLQVDLFRPGKYLGPKSVGYGKAFINVGGPSAVTGGATAWASVSTSDADICSYPGSATWYVGNLENSPVAARLKKAGITSTAWRYGVSGTALQGGCRSGFYYYIDSKNSINQNGTYDAKTYNSWQAGTLIGVSQAGNTITFASFSSYNSNGTMTDSADPVDQITYVLVPAP